MSIEDRPEFKAAQIQREADGFTAERLAERETYRARIRAFIARRALTAPGEEEES